MGPHLLEKIPSLLRRQGLHEVLFRRGQDTLKTDHQQIIDQVRVNVLGPAPHVILLEAAKPLADGCFDLSLAFHANTTHSERPAAKVAVTDRDYNGISSIIQLLEFRRRNTIKES